MRPLSHRNVCIVVGVAGNQGSDGVYSQNAPASGRSVVSVASVDNSFYLTEVMSLNIIPDENFRKCLGNRIHYSLQANLICW